MGRVVIFLICISTVGFGAGEEVYSASLERVCLSCHQEQQIPSDLIYRRYLMKYSTPSRMESAMLAYLKDPKKEYSIMPPQFFLKFPMKKPIKMNERELRHYIEAYLKRFDVKKRLILAE